MAARKPVNQEPIKPIQAQIKDAQEKSAETHNLNRQRNAGKQHRNK